MSNPYPIDLTPVTDTDDVDETAYNRVVENLLSLKWALSNEEETRDDGVFSTYFKQGAIHLEGVPHKGHVAAGLGCLWYDAEGVTGVRQTDLERRQTPKVHGHTRDPRNLTKQRFRNHTVIEGQRFTNDNATIRADLGGSWFMYGSLNGTTRVFTPNFDSIPAYRLPDGYSAKELAIRPGDSVLVVNGSNVNWTYIEEVITVGVPNVSYDRNLNRISSFRLATAPFGNQTFTGAVDTYLQVFKGSITFRDCIFEIPAVFNTAYVNFEFCYFLKQLNSENKDDPQYKNGRVDLAFKEGILDVPFEIPDSRMLRCMVFACDFMAMRILYDTEPHFHNTSTNGMGFQLIANLYANYNGFVVTLPDDEVDGWIAPNVPYGTVGYDNVNGIGLFNMLVQYFFDWRQDGQPNYQILRHLFENYSVMQSYIFNASYPSGYIF